MNNTVLRQAPVVANDEVANEIFWMRLKAPQISAVNQPGQFINILTNPDGEPLWRRPFSVARVSGELIEIIYKAIGIGTYQMAGLQPGDTANIIGPLGNQFSVNPEEEGIPLLIGGGLGFAPLVILRDFFVEKGIHPVLFMGALNKNEHYYREDPDTELFLTTDDGSLGYHGLVTEQLVEYLDKAPGGQKFVAYSCGPEPMMKAVARICADRNISLQLSIEREMACGIGLCQGCSIEQRPPHKTYALVCKDGPIFNAENLAFTE
ncbi:MAG: dihydroorotate dehydrogenase electron transfer subunit [Candidatus Marinimicrobia bacterium]|nr:dihydroorotate dehydrogenase electron transfer subunit [Candidatus Neomarinimicrobiota bacterium]MCF7880583.1 dihydroorotate dehydrogenase electron transfer subunit [Candidatus Neomarinimicrobiota bacterium]